MVITKEIEYRGDGKLFKGFCAYPDNRSNLSAILIAPAWAGRDKFACEKAIYLAKKGYLAFAIDVYGDAKVGQSKEENASLMTPLLEDKYALMTRLRSAYSTVSRMARVDKTSMAAIGFCFGGRCVLDMARSNLDFKAAISFHGSLETHIEREDDINTKILVLHGYNDPMVTPEQVNKFHQEMDSRNADCQFHSFSQTYHSFSNPEANDPEFGTVYNALLNKRAWRLTESFLKETLIGRL